MCTPYKSEIQYERQIGTLGNFHKFSWITRFQVFRFASNVPFYLQHGTVLHFTMISYFRYLRMVGWPRRPYPCFWSGAPSSWLRSSTPKKSFASPTESSITSQSQPCTSSSSFTPSSISITSIGALGINRMPSRKPKPNKYNLSVKVNKLLFTFVMYIGGE